MTIPFALVLIEVIVFRSIRLRYPLIFLTTIVVIFFTGLAFSGEGSVFHQVDALTRESNDISRLEYLLVQSSIITVYIQKFFLPMNLHLDYGLTLASFSSFQKVGALIVHLLILISALAFRNKTPLFLFQIQEYYSLLLFPLLLFGS